MELLGLHGIVEFLLGIVVSVGVGLLWYLQYSTPMKSDPEKEPTIDLGIIMAHHQERVIKMQSRLRIQENKISELLGVVEKQGTTIQSLKLHLNTLYGKES